MSFGKSSSKNASQSTSNQSLDPQIRDSLLQNYGNAQKLVGNTPTAYKGQLVAGFNPTQLAGQQSLLNVANSGVGNDTLNNAIHVTGGVGNFTPQQIHAGQLSNTDLSPYMNPYTQQVTDRTLADLDRQRQIANVGNDAKATQAGAFGGDRSAVLNSLTNGEFARTGATTLANLNQAAYTNAQGAAGTDIAARQAADTSNQNAGVQGANLNLSAGQGLAAMSGQQLSQAAQLAGLTNQVGNQQQAQEQAGLTANKDQFQTELGNKVTLQQLLNQALGLAGNPVLNSAQSTGSGSSSSISFSKGG